MLTGALVRLSTSLSAPVVPAMARPFRSPDAGMVMAFASAAQGLAMGVEVRTPLRVSC